MIILTTQDAELVRGGTTYALEPVPLMDGSFALPPRVLEDPHHERHWQFLSSLPQREVSDEEFIRD